MSTPQLNRVELLIGTDNCAKLKKSRVIVFGVGGVGSWCAESLVRSGVGHVTIVDSDLICATNINRQIQATKSTIGRVKVFELERRLKDISPDVEVLALQKIFSHETKEEFAIESYDIVIDAIDSLGCKAELIRYTLSLGITLFSSLGASGRIDPSMIRVGSIWKTKNCRLGYFLRKRLRRSGFSGNFTCVFSEELPSEPCATESGCASGNCVCPQKALVDEDALDAHEWCSLKKQINGSIVHITASFGMFLSGLAIQKLMQN